MGGKSTPAAPDYAAAAQQQAQSSRDVTEQQSWGNRPDQITPFGSQTWGNQMEWDPSTQQYLNKWTQTTNLTPQSQKALDDQFAQQAQRSALGTTVTNRIGSDLGEGMNWKDIQPQIGAPVHAQDYGDMSAYRQKMEDNLYSRATSRLDPMWDKREQAQRAQLYNMGAKEGDPAYNEAMHQFNQDRNDAYQQAQYGATAGGGVEQANQIGMGGQIQSQQQQGSAYDTQLRQQAIAEELQKRGQNLNEANAIMSGQQVGLPSMPSFSQNAASQGVQSLQAADMQGQADLAAFNAKQQATQGMISGVGSIAGGMM